ncbi:hypothetical protein ACWDBD_17060 [Streptomyces sp. NPDC001118]
MRRLIELPVWVLAVTVLAAGAIGGGACAGISCLVDRTRGRQP